jgi:hypothetical protein
MVSRLLASAAGGAAGAPCCAGVGVAGCGVDACWLPAAPCTDAGEALVPGDAVSLTPPTDLRHGQTAHAPIGQAQGRVGEAI